MATEAQLKAISNTQLASNAQIPATKHRTVNDAIIEEMFNAQSRADVLSDVQVAGALDGGDRVLVIRGGQGYLLDADDFGFIDKLVDLTDVNITSPLNNQVVAWDAATSRFVAKSIDNIPQGGTVNLVGNQTVNGVKTFTNAIVQSVAAQNPNELTRLDQVQALLSGISWRKPIINFVDFTTAEPASPTSGDRYINTVTGSGSITTGQTFTINRIYEWDGSAWIENTPLQGWTVVNNDDSIPYNYNSTAWVAISTGTLPSNVALTDEDNQFSVSQTINGNLVVNGDGGAPNPDAKIIIDSKHTTVTTNNELGRIVFKGSDSDLSDGGIGAFIKATADSGWTVDPFDAPTRLEFYTQSNSGAVNALTSPRMVIKENGNVGIGTTSPSEKLDVDGNVKATSFIGSGALLTNLPSTPATINVVTNPSTDTDYAVLFSPIGSDVTLNGDLAELKYNPSTGKITANSIAKVGGTSSQFLKADGSVDSTVYGRKRVTLGTNPTSLDAEDYSTVIGTATYTASTTLTFSNASNLDELALQFTNTNANTITFAGLTFEFKDEELPDGVSFATNALTFPADSAVKYNIVGVRFDGTNMRAKIEIN